MKIVLINQYAGSPSLGMEYRPHWMATEWIKAGHDVLIVAGDVSHLRLAAPPMGRSVIDGVDFLTLRTLAYTRNGPRRLANMLSFKAQLYRYQSVMRNWNPDVVIASSTHPFDIRPAIHLSRSCDARFVYEVHDLWPLTPQLLGGYSPSHPMIRLMKREELLGYGEAELAISLLPGTEDYMLRSGLKPSRWLYAPNGVEPSPEILPAPAKLKSEIASLRRSFPTTLIHAGGMGLSNNLDLVLQSLARLEEIGAGVVLVGDGPERERLVRSHGRAANARFLPPVPRPQVFDLLRSADAGLLASAPSPLYEYGLSPNKLFDYMLAGLPVLEFTPGPHRLVERSGCGLFAEPSHAGVVVKTVEQFLAADPAQRREWALAGRSYVAKFGSREAIARSILAALDRRPQANLDGSCMIEGVATRQLNVDQNQIGRAGE